MYQAYRGQCLKSEKLLIIVDEIIAIFNPLKSLELKVIFLLKFIFQSNKTTEYRIFSSK